MSYRDIRGHIEALEKENLLYRIKREINKNTELHPLVRWQYRGGLPDEARKAFLFENVVDSKGKRYEIPVGVAVYAGSKRIYAIGLDCEVNEIPIKWEKALSNPIEAVVVSSGPVHEEIHTGEELRKEGGGLDEFPVPISTPGFDNAPYLTAGNLVTKDPETRVRNVGNYRAQIKARGKVGIFWGSLGQDAYIHWLKCKEKGVKVLEAALIIGAPPVVGYTAAQKVARGVDEFSISGALAGNPLHLVKCKTVDIEVPADAEIVFEGVIPTDYLEPEGPFGESHGHMNPRILNPYFEVTAITHRKKPIFTSWISQLTPSESSIIKKCSYDYLFYRYLKNERRVHSVSRVVMHEPMTNLRKVIIVQLDKPTQAETWRALQATITRDPGVGKIVIAVDKDIDPDNLDAVFWAMAFRMNPIRDVRIIDHRLPSTGPPFKIGEFLAEMSRTDDSALLMDATLKEPYPPVSLPKKEYMERAKEIWEELGFPKITPQNPWFGYSLGQWDDEVEEEARLAVQGEHYITGAKLAGRKVKV